MVARCVISAPSHPDLDLATVQRDIWELERLLSTTTEVVASEVTEHRRRQLDALLARREALQPPPIDDGPLAHPGLGEPLPRYPPGEAPPTNEAPASSKPPRSGLERDAREALTRLGELYLLRRKSDPIKTVTGPER